jgi:hypothetical protein
MVITKDALIDLANTMPEKVDIEEVFDRILILAKLEQAMTESEQGLGQEWEEFKEEWLKKDL